MQTLRKESPGSHPNQPNALSMALSQALKNGNSACCAQLALPSTQAVPAGRGRLRALPKHLYCSILGTCFTTQHLKKLLARCTNESVEHLGDLEVHEEMVVIAASNDVGCRLLNVASGGRS